MSTIFETVRMAPCRTSSSTSRGKAAQKAPGGLGGLIGMLDRDGDGNPLNDLGRLGGLFGAR